MKDGTVVISRGGRVVTTIRGAAARRLLAAIEGAPDAGRVQHLLARATGDYRRGNERAGRRR